MVSLVTSVNDIQSLIACSDENRALIQKNDKCDRYDYLAAVACGAIGGMIDIFLVGAPGDSVLGKWTDAQVDNAVKGFAKLSGWSPRADKADNVASAIGFLEKRFKVNYDHRYSADVGNLFNMSTKNHHMMSLAHSPDVIGLFFSILNQFTSTASFITNGQLITIRSETFELQGGNFISKIFSGVANWFGHVMSDIAGSSGSRANVGRGTGVVMPFYELFGFCKFGKFNVGKDKQDLATIATRAFQEGYDLRFGLAMAIPVVITDLSIRLIWSLRRYFQYGKSLKECIPTQKHADLRVMLLFGNGTLCVMDGIDAGVRSGGNFLAFFMRLNLIAWFRFVTLVLKEICIRVGISSPLQAYLEAYKRINEALLLYLQELEKIDIERFRKETEEYNHTVELFYKISTKEELNVMLLNTFDRMGFNKPWQGNFEEHMSNKNATLTFE
ncbi:hypothetical protein [Clostridium algidicarnis]|uniref:hypothetical protein n=1 Tax=Clostridium algidicarnis TaxID=37659 RepID=UPI001C0BBA3B|nr:hypothetical protein [Clostridium algidicarnis]MBU3193092.1 hypothetical protein [Clostridium algidicarnis]